MYEQRTALFWAIAQRVVVLLTDLSGEPVGAIFKTRVISASPKSNYVAHVTFVTCVYKLSAVPFRFT